MKRIVCILLAVLFCLSFAACGKSNDTATKDSATNDSATIEGTVSVLPEPSESGESVKKFESVEDYLNDPQVKANIDAQTEQESDVVKLNVFAQGDSLVYEYTYLTHIEGEKLDAAKKAIEDSFEDSSAVFDQAVEELKKYVAMENPKVKMIYRNDDESVIFEKVFE